MNAKELKLEKEKLIKNELLDFQKESGLEVSYIEVTKEKSLGFKNSEDIKVSIRLKD